MKSLIEGDPRLRRLRSTPTTRAIDSHFDYKAFGGSEALWHGSGCTCASCGHAGYACACGDPHCEDESHG